MTVLFARILGLQTLSDQLDLDEARALTRSCLDFLFEPIYKYGGTLDKFFRQMIMVLFGAPTVHEDDAERALHAALEMSMALEQFNLEETDRLPQPLSLSCGINTGLVFAGEVGAMGKESYSVVGDHVNLAHRLAYLADSEQILLGENTYRQTRHLFRFSALPPIDIRGKHKTVQIYQLKGTQGVESAEGLSPVPHLVGRDEEIARFRQRLRQLRDGEGGIIRIEGPAGVGKSRLVSEVRDVEPDLRWMEGRSLSYSTNWPLTSFKDLLRRWFNVDHDSEKVVKQRVQHTLEEILPPSVDWAYPVVLHLLDIPPDTPEVQPFVRLSAEGVRARTIAAMHALLKALAKARPTVVVLEDFHWTDQSSVDLLEKMLPLTQEVPLLFVIVIRPEESIGLQWPALIESDQSASLLTLPPLSPEETTTLVKSLLGSSTVPQVLRTYIQEKVEGNPLFVREVVHTLLEEEILTKKNDSWQLIEVAHQLEIPFSLRGLLASRIDRLPARVKETLGYAAVIGR